MKNMTRILLVLLLLASCVLPVSAASRWIIDGAGLLTEDEITNLDALAANLVNEYQMDIVIVTVDSLGNKSSEQFADDYFDENGYGYGENFSGVLLLLSMEYRDWAISTCGDTIYALTDYGIQELFGSIAGYLADDAYYEAFCQFLFNLEPYLQAHREGAPVDGRPGS